MNHFTANSPHARDIASVLHPQTNARRHLEVGPTIMTGARGIFVEDDAGNSYLDAGAGLWCCSLGYNNERLAKVAYEAMRTLGYYQIFRHASHGPAIDLSEKLLSIAPVPMSKVLLQCSGSEANDSAVKLVWYHWRAQGKPEKRKIISRMGSYHGSTCVAISLTGNPSYHAGFGLPFEGFLYTDRPNHYRDALPGETEEQFSQRLADNLEALILREGPETIAALWADPVQGTAGALPPPRGYFEKIQAVLKKYDVLLVADEVICGFGRTGRMWGCETFNIQPDMITCAKALSAAMQPISAVLMNERIFESVMAQSDKNGAFIHGYTYAGHPVAASVALETLKIYEEMDLLGHVSSVEPVFRREIGALVDHPMVGNFNSIGLIGGIEIVRDKATKQDWPAGANLTGRLDAHARANGLILRITGNRVAFSPPLIITAEEIRELARRLRRTLDATHAELLAL
ncbi:MAG: aminotransferase class III-fold pyridoxal phosphate-dependent enzyme [Roseomonas sp.]|nr:aminotransferase class III-fold pyridoxal phosphate-dependent enzyme [Roseomonas sp.]